MFGSGPYLSSSPPRPGPRVVDGRRRRRSVTLSFADYHHYVYSVSENNVRHLEYIMTFGICCTGLVDPVDCVWLSSIYVASSGRTYHIECDFRRWFRCNYLVVLRCLRMWCPYIYRY